MNERIPSLARAVHSTRMRLRMNLISSHFPSLSLCFTKQMICIVHGNINFQMKSTVVACRIRLVGYFRFLNSEFTFRIQKKQQQHWQWPKVCCWAIHSNRESRYEQFSWPIFSFTLFRTRRNSCTVVFSNQVTWEIRCIIYSAFVFIGQVVWNSAPAALATAEWFTRLSNLSLDSRLDMTSDSWNKRSANILFPFYDSYYWKIC